MRTLVSVCVSRGMHGLGCMHNIRSSHPGGKIQCSRLAPLDAMRMIYAHCTPIDNACKGIPRGDAKSIYVCLCTREILSRARSNNLDVMEMRAAAPDN